MASFVNANLGSDSDSDDQDYDPTQEAGQVVSEEENSGDDDNAESGTKKLKKSKKKRKEGGRIGGIFLEEDEQTKAENEAKGKEFEQEIIKSKQKRQVSVSDISDAELPATASIGKDSSDNLEELEKIQVLECKICKASVPSNYEKHYKSCQSVQHYVTSNPITCILCDLTFDSTQEVFRHVKQDHGLDEFGDDEGRNFFIHIFF